MQTCVRNYFVQNGSNGFTVINESLAKLEQKERERIEKERGEYILKHSCSFSNNLSPSDNVATYLKMLLSK